MSRTLRRVKAHRCTGPDTYKYYFRGNQVSEIWTLLEEKFGPVRRDENFRVMEIRSSAFIFRALFEGNPITVMRRRRCRDDDVRNLHEVIGFDHDRL